MKKIMHITVAFLALAMLASCQKAQIENPSMVGLTSFTANILQTKTAIASDGKVTWNEGDEITVTDAAEPANSAVYVAQSSGSSTTFSLKSGETAVTTAPYKASYGDLDNQIYSATGANCPLAAPETDETNFTFSSPYAVLKITATTGVDKLISKVTIENGTTTLATLDCGSGVDLLSASSGTVFYVAVEPSTYDALRISLETIDSVPEKATKARSAEVVLKAGDLLPVTLSFSSDDWTPACVAAGTMITMENGERKAVEALEIGDVIRTIYHKTGLVSSAPVCFIWETKDVAKAFTLTFEDNTEVTVIEEHGFYDQEESKYAFINAYNAKNYYGHHFYDADNDRWLELKSCKLLNEGVDAYAVVTSSHLNHLSNGMLSMCDGSIKFLANLFEYDEHMKFDEDKKAADIEEFGLTPLEKVLEYKGFTEADYYDYNLQYLDVIIGKGLTTWDRVKAYSDYCEAYLNH